MFQRCLAITDVCLADRNSELDFQVSPRQKFLSIEKKRICSFLFGGTQMIGMFSVLGETPDEQRLVPEVLKARERSLPRP